MKQHRLVCSMHSCKVVIEITLTILGFSTSPVFSAVVYWALFHCLLLILLNKLNETACSILAGLLGML